MGGNCKSTSRHRPLVENERSRDLHNTTTRHQAAEGKTHQQATNRQATTTKLFQHQSNQGTQSTRTTCGSRPLDTGPLVKPERGQGPGV